MGAGPGQAQGFPTRPVTIIVPFPAGGTTDAQMRTLAEQTSRTLGQPVLVDNRPGAGSTLGAAMVARVRPDGYLLTQLTSPAIRLQFMQHMAYDVLKDFTPIIHLTGYLFGIIVRADAPWQSWAEFIADARRRPAAITVGNSGANGTPHVTMMQLSEREGIQFTHVPFRGEGDATPAFLGGHIDALATGSGIGRMVDDGKARWLNIWTANRSKSWPDVPTLVELGYPDLVATSPYGLVGPAGMDPAVVHRLHNAFAAHVRGPEHMAVLERFDMELDYRDSEAYAIFLREQVEREQDLVKRLNLRSN
jgi:tripartite-type tricarboxylate transporter receptor subunit TctC